jgi:hypothetical protein
VAQEAQGLAVHFRPGLEEGQRRFCIGREIEGGGGGVAAGGLADAAFVIAEYVKAVPGEMVGQHQERAVPEDRLVPVIWP